MTDQWLPADPPGGGEPPHQTPPLQAVPPTPPTQQPPQTWQQGGQGVPPGVQPPPPSGYGAPPTPPPGAGWQTWGGSGSPPATTEKDARGFFAALFDYNFSHFGTPMIVRFLYVLVTIGVAIGYLFYVLVAFSASSGFGVLLLLVIGPIVSIVILAFYRLTLELYLSVRLIAEDIRRIQRAGGQL